MPCTWMVALAMPASDSVSLMNPFTPMCTCIVEKSNYRLTLAKGDSQTTHAILLTDSMSLLQKSEKWTGKPRQECVDGWRPPWKAPVSVLHALDMPEWREMGEQIDWRAKQPSQVACFSENMKCWEAWDTTCRNKAKDITPLITWRRAVWKEEVLDDLPWKDERGPSSTRRILELFQRQRWGNFWETKRSTYGLFQAHKYHLELNWTALLLLK